MHRILHGDGHRTAALVFACLLSLGCEPASQIIGHLGDENTPGQEAELDPATSEDSANKDPAAESLGPEAATRVYYQFNDAAGRVHFVSRISDVPESWQSRVGYVEMNSPPPLTPAEARASWQLSASRAAEAKQRSRPQVVLYSAGWCGWCRKAEKHLAREDVDYERLDVDNPAVMDELVRTTGRKGVPVLEVRGEILRGYNERAYERLLATL